MYENRHARFTAVDPLLASGKSANPQTFNRYVYVMNRPLILTDPAGLQAASDPEEESNFIIRILVRACESFGGCWTKNTVSYGGKTHTTGEFMPAIHPIEYFQADEIETLREARGNVVLRSVTPTTGQSSETFYRFGTPEDNAQLVSTLRQEPTGLFDLQYTAYQHSIGQASNSDLAKSSAIFGVNFVPFGSAGKAAKEGSEVGFTRLFRAVSQGELDDIVNFGVRLNPDGTGYQGVKLFAETADDAVWFGRNNQRMGFGPSHIISVDVPNSIFAKSYRGSDLSTNFISIPAEELNRVQNVRIFTFSPFRRQ